MVATTLSVGDLGIIGVDTEDNGNPQRDSITIILLRPIGSLTVIYFTDRAWNGTSFAALSAGEGTFIYTAATDLPAGTIITITQAQLTAAGINLSDAGETIYAYQGTSADAPTRFLHAIDIADGTLGFDGTELTNTGLVNGVSAVAFGSGGNGVGIADTDNAEFGGRTHNIQTVDLFARINTATAWVQNNNSPQDGTAVGSPVLTAPDAQIWIGGSGGGNGIVTINLDGTYSSGTLGYQIVQAFQNATSLFHPSDITLDTVEDKYFFVDSDASGQNRIIQGSISQLLANPSAPTFTVLYSNAGTSATGVIQSLAVDTINNRIYFDIGTATTGSTINRINYDTAGQTPTVLATLGAEQYVTQLAIDFTRGSVFAAVSVTDSVFGTDALTQNYVLRATVAGGTALALSTAAAGSLTFTQLPFNPDDTGQTGEGGPLPGEAFPVEFGAIRGIDVDPVSNALIIVTASITLDNDGNGNTTYTGRIVRYALDSNPTGNITTLFQQTGTPGQAGTGPRGLLYHVEADAATGRYYVVDSTGLNADPGDASVWTGSLTVAGTPTLVGTVGNINGLGGRGLEILHAPTLTGTNLAATVTEAPGNPSANALIQPANTFTANDSDSANSPTQQLAGAQVRITAGLLPAVDLLTISGALPAGITSSYNAATGVLTLSGISTFANYQTALAQVRLTVQGDNPTNFGANTTRTLAYSTFDGALYSDEVTATVSVVGTNDAPTSTGLQGDSVTTTEPAGAGSVMSGVNIDSGANATFADVDNLNFAGGTLRFAITAGRDAAQDQLLIDTTGIVTISGGVVSVSGTAIGSVTGGGAGGSDLVIALNGNATPALVQSVVRVVFFTSTGGDNPTAGARTITTTLVDGSGIANSGTDTLTITSTVNVVATNDAPTLTSLPLSAGPYTSGVAGNVDLSASTIADVDSANVTVTLSSSAPGTFTTATVGGVTIGGTAAAPTLSGTVAAINTYLDTASNVQFTPSSVYNGANTITVNLTDGTTAAAPQNVTADVSFTPVSLGTAGTALTQDFNALANTGTAALTIRGWALSEAGTGANATYTANNGGSNAGDTYSYGATGAGDRAFGGLQSAANVPTIGAAFTNNTGATLTSLLISYLGEQWRLGTSGRADKLDFQYSLNATSLTTGTWVDVDALDFTAPVSVGTVGALDGNAAANRTSITSEITGLTLAPGVTVWIRWNSFDATGADDGLGIDDFSITPRSITAGNDTGTVNENATILNGNLFGNDAAPGGTLAVGAVNGVVGNVGNQITLASGATVTVRANGTYDYNPNGQFNTLIDAATALATGAVNTSATDTFTYTLNGGQTATVTVTVNGVASAGDQLGGNGGNNTITGTPGVDTFNLTLGGNDTVTGGDSNDAFIFGGTFDALDTVDGGAGTNDQVGLSGNYSGGIVLGPNTLTNVEVLAALPGNSYNVTSNDGNVAAGQTLSVFGGNLLVGNNFTFNGSAETDGMFRMYGGLGNDTFTGGALDDGFYFGPGKWGAGDTVVGGGGTNDQLALDGDYTIGIGANANVETLILLPGPVGTPNNFNIALFDVWTGAGATKTVWGLNVTTAMTIDGTAETNGNLIIFGGRASDQLYGGNGADAIYGGGGGDFLFGGAGADTFRYDDLTDSNGATNATRDRIVDFASGVDKIDLSRIDAIAGGADDPFSFIGAGSFTNVAGQLRYTDTGAGGIFIVEGDVNGDGLADFTLSVTMTPATPPLATDFVL